MNIGKDFLEVLKRAYLFAKKYNLRFITPEIILYEISELYLEDSKGICDSLLKYFGGFTFQDKKVFKERVRSKVEEQKTACFNLPNLYQSTSITVDKKLLDFLNSSSQCKDFSFIFKQGIDSDILLYTILSDKYYDSIINELSDNTKLSNLKQYITQFNIKKGFDEAIEDEDDKEEEDESLDGALNLSDFFKDLANNPSEVDSSEKMKEDDDKFAKYGDDAESDGINIKKPDPNSKTPFLDRYSIDMTKNAKLGKYDPVYGRESEISQIIEILCHRKKNNAILVGDPGVGKTSVVELLAQKIVSRETPEKLRDKRICSLDLNGLVAGTKYRGQYEERLQGIIKEVVDNPNIIVFIDEFHNLIGNGNSSGSGDGANILKPYLARGEFQCIGSTTQEEYRKYIEKDGALKRRFLNVQINEPNEEETLSILKTASSVYEKNHHVRYTKDILRVCVEWSGRYISDRYFPDKAIDIMDASGTLRMLKTSHTEDPDYTKLEKEISELKDKKQKAVEKQDFETAADLRNQQRTKEKELESKKQAWKKSENSRTNWPEVTIDDVARAISEVSKIPVDKIRETDNEMLSQMKKALESSVIGQQEAIDTVVRCLQRNYLGLRDEHKAIASLLMCGPTGVGKTYLAKIVAQAFFGSEKNLVKFDMSQLTSEADVSRLLGSSPGYVGYDDEAELNKIRTTNGGNVVCLFDEIEKANPKVYDIFLNILDEGYCTLANGIRIDFTNSIIMFTSNVGSKELKRQGSGIGFNKAITSEEKNKINKDTVKKSLDKVFRPEFLNRLTSVVTFNELGVSDLGKIFNIELGKKKTLLRKKGYQIKVSSALKKHVVELCDTGYGARDLTRNIETEILDQLGESMLKNPTTKSFELDYDKDKDEVIVGTQTPKKKEVKVEVKKEAEVEEETK